MRVVPEGYDGVAGVLHRLGHVVTLGGLLAVCLHHPVGTDPVKSVADEAFCPFALDDSEAVHRHRFDSFGACGAQDGAGERVPRMMRLQGGGAFQELPSRMRGERRDLPDLGTAVGQRAGLVQRQRPKPPRGLQVHPAFNKDAAPGGGGQAGDDADRRGDDQGAGTGDHKNDQAAVKPFRPRCPGENERDQSHAERQRHHGGGVIARELLDPLLYRGAP